MEDGRSTRSVKAPVCPIKDLGFNKGVRAFEETDVKESSHLTSFMFLKDHYSDKMEKNG